MRRTLALLLVFIIYIANPTAVLAQPDGTQTQESNAEISIGVVGVDNYSEVPAVEAVGAVLIEQNTGEVLFSKNSDMRLYPASTTKILTALLAIEHGDLDEVVTVGEEANLVTRDGSKAGLKLNEEITLGDLIRGLMLASGNDAANTIAVHIGRKVSKDPSLSITQAMDYFVEMMNSRAQELGAKNSHFANPHGYHDDNHYTTALDLALIKREALKHQFYREVVATCLYSMEDWSSVNEENPEEKEIRYWRNSNALIQKNDKFYYEYATGGKTGYTSKAGQCLVSSATRGDMNLISVVLNSSKEGKWTDSVALLEYGFENYQYRQFISEGQTFDVIQVTDHSEKDSGLLRIKASRGFSGVFRIPDADKIETVVELKENLLAATDPEEDTAVLKAPISRGQVVGTLKFMLHGEILDEVDLIASRNVAKWEPVTEEPQVIIGPILEPILNVFHEYHPLIWYWIAGGVAAFILLIIIASSIRKKRRRGFFYRHHRY